MPEARKLPNVAEMIGPLLQRVSRDQRPLLLAIAERMAAERYREWARRSKTQARRSALLACADREEEIAGLVEGLYPEAAAVQADILAKNPDLADLNREIFADRPLAEQYAMQAQGERAGALTWRSFAEHAETASARQTLLDCAELEEQSAAVLNAILDEEP